MLALAVVPIQLSLAAYTTHIEELPDVNLYDDLRIQYSSCNLERVLMVGVGRWVLKRSKFLKTNVLKLVYHTPKGEISTNFSEFKSVFKKLKST